MLKINSLLNPTSEHDRYGFASSVTPPPSTPADSSQTFSAPPPSQPTTPLTPSPKRQKRVKDANGFAPTPIRGPVNYPPFECDEQSFCLTNSQLHELEEQHRYFKVEPHGPGAGSISSNVRHIPYSSDKRGFLDKTGRGGFDVFRYSFVAWMAEDKNGTTEWKEKKYTVMWDYQIGLVRITPFFKACKYTKTTPNKALSANPGLKELCHSVTGGSVEAQGYWVPYACARAICLTFCHKIRWALTPIFGPSFIRECLHPDSVSFGRFKIDPEFVRNSALEQEGWKAGIPSHATTPACLPPAEREIPRSAPVHEHVGAAHRKPEFKQGSPFSERNYIYSSPATESPALSPKSKHHRTVLPPIQSPSWTSINRPGYDSALSSPPTLLSGSLLNEPRFSSNVSWRPAEAANTTATTTTTSGPRTRLSARRSVVSAGAQAATTTSFESSDSSSSDDEPIQKKRKMSSSRSSPTTARSGSRQQRKAPRKEMEKEISKKWTEEDMKAAQWLLNLHNQPRNFRPTQALRKRMGGEEE